jgi:virginiamycin B lyase
MQPWTRIVVSPILLLAIVAPACGDEQTPAAGASQIGASEIEEVSRPDKQTCGQIDEFSIPTLQGVGLFPQGIVGGSDGKLWFALGSALGRLSPDDGSVSLITVPDTQVRRLALGPDGNIWFPTDALGVARLTRRRSTEDISLPGLGSFFSDLTAGPDHAVWVLGSDAIARVTVSGQATYFPKAVLNSSNGDHIIAGPDGNLWFTGNGAQLIHRMTRTGVITDFTAPGPGQVFGLAAGPDGAVWFTQQGGGPNDNSIGRITVRGVASTVVQLPDSTSPPGEAPSDMPLEITAGPDGNLYFTTYLVEPKNYIGQVTPQGRLRQFEIPTAGAASFGITTGSDDNIWFTENFNQLVGRLTITSCRHHPREDR